MSQYYFLISGLQDLLVGDKNDSRIPSIDDFVSFCEEQMSAKDFALLKKVFIFNDIKNVVNYQKTGNYIKPAYYAKDEFDENLKDKDLFFEFISNFYQDMKTEHRLYPQMTEEDELIMRFYENIDSYTAGNDFLAQYFKFELVLRNILTVANMRKADQDSSDFIIKTEDFGENIAKSTSSDFGIGTDYPFVSKINEIVQKGDLVELEETLDKIRFDFIDNILGYETFTVNVVMAYAVKLMCVARWQSLSPEKGRQIFEQIVAQIRENIKFSDEFSVVGGKK